MQTYTETIKAVPNTDFIKIIINNLDKWELPTMPNYVGNNFEVYASKDLMTEIVVRHDTREITTSYKA